MSIFKCSCMGSGKHMSQTKTSSAKINKLISLLLCNSLFLSSLVPLSPAQAKLNKETKSKTETPVKASQAPSSFSSQSNSPREELLQLESQEIKTTTFPYEALNSQTDASTSTTNDNSEVVLKGSATRILDKEARVTVSVMSLLSSEFSTEGDLVEAKILVKPSPNGQKSPLEPLKGSKLIGHVVEVKRSRKGGRSGFVKVQFDSVKIRNGKEFPVKAEMTTEEKKGKEAGKLIVHDLKLMTLGALWGTYNSLKWSPLAAIATNGLSVAASAGIGVALGIIGSVRRKGDVYSFFPGEKRSISMKDALSLSDEMIEEANAANSKLESDLIGLKLEVQESSILPSEQYDRVLQVKVKVNNYTSAPVYPCDLLLIPNDGADPVAADIRSSGLELLKSISKEQSSEVTLVYPLPAGANAKDFSLALIDPLDKAHLSKVSLLNVGSSTINPEAKANKTNSPKSLQISKNNSELASNSIRPKSPNDLKD